MARDRNELGCRFCGWVTTKWRAGEGPAKAFAQLRAHIDDAHPVEAEQLEDAAAADERRTDELVAQYERILS